MKCRDNIVGTTYWSDLDQAGKYKTSTMYQILRREKFKEHPRVGQEKNIG